MLPSSSFCYSPTRLTKIVEQIKELRHQVREFASAIERLAYEVRRIDEKVDYYARNEAQEREPQLTSGECAAKVGTAITARGTQ